MGPVCTELSYRELFLKRGSLRGSRTVRKTRQRKSHPVASMAAHLAASHCRDIISVKEKRKEKWAHLWQLLCGCCRRWLEQAHFKQQLKREGEIATKGIENIKSKALQIKTA